MKYPACTKLMGPVVPGATLHNGARVPGTAYELDPINAAFNIGAMIRWLDFNDTWLAAEWGHPSDNLGGILAVADQLSRSGKPVSVRDVLTGMIKAHEIQGVLALENSLNRVGLDHVLLVRAGVLQGRQRERTRAGGFSHRTSQAARGGHAGAGQEVRDQRRGAFQSEADRSDQGDVRGSEGARGDAGERVRRGVGHSVLDES